MILNLSVLPSDLLFGAKHILDLLGFTENEGGIPIHAEQSNTLSVHFDGNDVFIKYKRKNEFFRALNLLKRHETQKTFFVEEYCSTEEFGVMLDCSRNAVRNLTHLKEFIGYIALEGYNQLQLYTEDTYEIQGEPYFGYLRGRYTQDELCEIVNYAEKFGIEVIPCIQTLAHLNQLFRWSSQYEKIHDIDDILLIDSDETYALIEKMIITCKHTFHTDKIHIGMDEAHLVGRGKYADVHGAVNNRHELLVRHLNKVISLCKKHGFNPLMWSDMFFRLAFHGEYYPDKNAQFDQSVLSDIPENISLVFWDYHHMDTEIYNRLIKMHQTLGRELYFAGGACRWHGITPNNEFSMRATKHALNACKENGVKNIFITLWGDDGAECSDYSVFPCLVAAAEQVYGHNDCKTAFFALTGISLEDFIKIDLANIIVPQDVDNAEMHNKTRLYNDLFLGLYDGYIKKEENEVFAEHANQLAKVEAVAGKFSYLFTAQRLLCETLSLKNELGVQTRNFYKKQNKAELEKLLNKRYLPLKQKLSEFSEAFYNQWLRENKPFGLEIQNYRIGGLKERISYCINVLQAYIDGSIEKIDELEESILPLAGYGVNRDFRGIISANKL